jgi:phosphoglycolate phosphatase-like HAD superfamily hydrolase
MKIRGIEITGAIFDMDGTLLDSMGTWYTVGSDYMRSLGMTPPETLDEDILRLTLEDAAKHIQSLGVDKPVHEIHAGINGVMDDFFLNRAECRPGVIDFLEKDGEILQFLKSVYRLAEFHVERYIERGFTDLMFSFGCTGGQHRSVYSAQHLAEHLHKKYGIHISLEHKEQSIQQEFLPKLHTAK